MQKIEYYKNIDTVESYTLINKKIKNKYVKEKIGILQLYENTV